MTKKILLAICIALNIWAFIGVISYGDFIDIIYYPIVILLLAYIFYRYYPKFFILFIFFNLLVVIKYFDSLNKVEGYPDKSMEDLYTFLAYFFIHIFFVLVLIKVINGRTLTEEKKIIIPIAIIIAAIAIILIFISLFEWSIEPLRWLAFLMIIIVPIILIILALDFFIRQIAGGELIQDRRIIIIIAIFFVLCYTPLISAPSSFVRQIIGAQLIQDNEADIYCVTKIDRNFICTLGEIEKSSTGENYSFRRGYAYDSIKKNPYLYYEKEYPGINNKYMYRSFFILDSRGGGSGGSMDDQIANMKKYYIDINHFFFKLSKKFRLLNENHL